eukprot:EG_transcript_7592
MNGMDVKRRDHAANVTVKLPFGAKPDVWQLVKKLFRFCGPCIENRTTQDSIRIRFHSMMGALNCLDHLHRLRLHHSLPALVVRTDDKLAVELLEFRIMATALDPHNQHTREMVKTSITRIVREWQEQHQAEYAPNVSSSASGIPEPKRSAEVLDADLIEGVEAAEEAIKAIQEMGALIDVDDGVVADSERPVHTTQQESRAVREPRQGLGSRENALVEERRLWEQDMERREQEEEQQRAWEREKWRLRRAGLYCSDDEEFQRRVGYERALRELQRRGHDLLAPGHPAPAHRRTTVRVSGEILKALNDTPLDIHRDGGEAPWLPSDEEPMEGSDRMESPPPPPPPPTNPPAVPTVASPDAPDSDDDWFARRRAERNQGRQQRAAKRQKETANEELRERIQRIQQRNRERLKLLGMMAEKPKLKPQQLLRRASLSDSSSSDADSPPPQPQNPSLGSETDEDVKRLKRTRRPPAGLEVPREGASSDTSDDIARLKQRRRDERIVSQRVHKAKPTPPRTPSPSRRIKSEPQSPAHWSGSSAHLSPGAPATHDEPKQSSVTTTVTPKREPHDDDAANEKTVGKRNAAPAPLITPAN